MLLLLLLLYILFYFILFFSMNIVICRQGNLTTATSKKQGRRFQCHKLSVSLVFLSPSTEKPVWFEVHVTLEPQNRQIKQSYYLCKTMHEKIILCIVLHLRIFNEQALMVRYREFLVLWTALHVVINSHFILFCI